MICSPRPPSADCSEQKQTTVVTKINGASTVRYDKAARYLDLILPDRTRQRCCARHIIASPSLPTYCCKGTAGSGSLPLPPSLPPSGNVSGLLLMLRRRRTRRCSRLAVSLPAVLI